MKQAMFVAAYTSYPPAEGTSAEGLFRYEMDEDGRLELLEAVDGGENPSFLALSARGDRLFLCNESGDGEVSAFAVALETGELRFLNRQKVQGADPCYVSLDPSERWLLAACYSSGSFSVFPVEQDGRLGPLASRVQHEGGGPNAQRQDRAHAHCIRFAPGGEFVLAVDLGMDRVATYRLEAQSGRLLPHPGGGLIARPGAGPRHLAYHPDGRWVYVANELDSTVSVCAWHGETGVLEEIQHLSTLDAAFRGENTAADLHLTPDGRFLYVSNRGENSLAAFAVDADSGHLSAVGRSPCGGDWPRNFAIHPNGQFLVVANQKSGNLAVFRIGEDGSLAATGHGALLTAPVCVRFAPLQAEKETGAIH